MAKKQLYYDEAERLYVIEQCTLIEIAKRLNLGEKTVQNWKNEGGWELKRAQYLESKQMFHEELYEFTRKLMKTVKEDMELGTKVDTGRLYTLTRLIPLVTKVKEYEDVRKVKETTQDKGLTEDVVKLIEQEVLGLER